MIERQLEILKTTRKNIVSIASAYTNEQLNFIPENFNNNMIWNMGHILVTQQLLCYKLSELQPKVSKELIDKYKKGSKPEGSVQNAEIEFIKERLFSVIDETAEDYEAELFKNFKNYTTSYGIELTNFEDALNFNNIHEGLHFGSVLALRKLI